MPINHSRRLSQPKTKTVIDPITNKRVFYSDYLAMEKERVQSHEASADETSQDDHNSQSTEQQKKSSGNQPDGWSDSEDAVEDGEDEDVNQNSDTTNSVLLLGQVDSPQDNNQSMQEKLRKALNQRPHEKKLQFVPGKSCFAQ